MYLRISEDKSKATNTHYLMSATAKLESDEISQEKYDFWRYKCPELDTTQIWAKVPSQEQKMLSWMLIWEQAERLNSKI